METDLISSLPQIPPLSPSETINKTITINLYDSATSKSVQIAINSRTTAELIFKTIQNSKHKDSTFDPRFFSLVLVVSVSNVNKKNNEHCLRTLKNDELLYKIQASIIEKQMKKYNISDSNKIENSCRWYFKDIRTNPIEFSDNGDVIGEYSSDEEMDISQSDLSYLAKSERKGYLLKRSNHDYNLWKKWYCVLLEQLWCIDISKENPKTKCVKLTGMIKYREGYKSLDQLQIIIINSDSRSHYFRAFNIIDQRNWIQDLNEKTNMVQENSYFNMAEVIISDEESTKCQRLIRQIDSILPTVILIDTLQCNNNDNKDGDLLLTNHNKDELIHNEITNKAIDDSTICIIDKKDITNTFLDNIEKINNNYDETILTSDNIITDFIPDESLRDESQLISEQQTSKLLKQDSINQSISNCELDNNNNILVSNDLIIDNLFKNNTKQLLINNNKTILDEKTIIGLNILNKIQSTNLVNHLYKEDVNLYNIMLFLLDVQRYRELFRHELSIIPKTQQNYVRYLYLTYILPQLKLIDIEYTSEFYNQVGQLGGNINNFYIHNRTSILISTTGTGTGISNYLGDITSSTVRNNNNNNNNNNQQEKIDWKVDYMKLLKVHQAVYEVCFNISTTIDILLIHASSYSNKTESTKDMIDNNTTKSIIDKNNIEDDNLSIKIVRSNTTTTTTTNNNNNNNHNDNNNNINNNNNNNNSNNIMVSNSKLVLAQPTSTSFWGSWFGNNSTPIKNSSNNSIGGDEIWRDISSKSPNQLYDNIDNSIIPNIELFDDIIKILLEKLK